jgi:hypothetical protein
MPQAGIDRAVGARLIRVAFLGGIALGCWGLSPGEWLWVGMSHRRVRIG